jgi:hypothetical protein
MTFPYGECRWFAASRPPFGAVAEHKVVSRRLGFRRHGRPIVAAVRREAESTRRRAVPRVANAGEGRAVDAGETGQHVQGISGITANLGDNSGYP